MFLDPLLKFGEKRIYRYTFSGYRVTQFNEKLGKEGGPCVILPAVDGHRFDSGFLF